MSDIMAECYGTLGKLSQDLAQMTRERDEARADASNEACEASRLRKICEELNLQTITIQAQVNSFYGGTADARLLAMTRERDALRAEVERLSRCIKRANDQAEEFERKWYLRGDEVERLRDTLHGIASWSEGPEVTPAFYEPWAAKLARAALQEPTP